MITTNKCHCWLAISFGTPLLFHLQLAINFRCCMLITKLDEYIVKCRFRLHIYYIFRYYRSELILIFTVSILKLRNHSLFNIYEIDKTFTFHLYCNKFIIYLASFIILMQFIYHKNVSFMR